MSSVRERIDASPISRFQIMVFAVLILCNVAEGYDLLSISIAIVPLSEDWNLTGSEIGTLLAMGPAGMAIGATILGALADRIGRRSVLLASLAIMTIFMLLSGFAQNLFQLSLFRLFASIGMGGIVPVMAVLAGEFAPARKRAAAVGLLTVGIPLGGMVGGAGAAILMSSYGWHSAFFLGASVGAVMIVLTWTIVPESPDYLQSRNTPKAQRELERLIDRMNLPDDSSGRTVHKIEDPDVAAGGRARLKSLVLVEVSIAFVLAASAYYFANLWLPKLLVVAGMSANQGIGGGVILSFGATLGVICLGILATRWSAFSISAYAMFATALLFALFAVTSSHFGAAFVTTAAIGFALNIGYSGLYAVVTILFAPDCRSTALGIALTAGRAGAISTPLLVGFLIDAGWEPKILFIAMVIPIALCAILTIHLHRTLRRQPTTSEELSEVESVTS